MGAWNYSVYQSNDFYFQEDGTWYSDFDPGAEFSCEKYELCQGCVQSGNQYDPKNFTYRLSQDTLFLSAYGYLNFGDTIPLQLEFIFEIEITNRSLRGDVLTMTPINTTADQMMQGGDFLFVEDQDYITVTKDADEKDCK